MNGSAMIAESVKLSCDDIRAISCGNTAECTLDDSHAPKDVSGITNADTDYKCRNGAMAMLKDMAET